MTRKITMPKFAFKPYGTEPADHDDVLISVSEATRLRDHVKAQGHDAEVESSGGGREYRVWIKHPTRKNSVAYVTRADAAMDKINPYWIDA